MTIPMYVPPEQLTKDRAEFARKGVARGRPVVVFSCAAGVLLATENPSRSLRKISEIYDRIGFAAVGKYNEFEALRVAGIRFADLRGYSYARGDVSGRALAGAYAQTLGTVFTTEAKPLEVEIALAEVAGGVNEDRLFRVTFDGSVAEEQHRLVMGGHADHLSGLLAERWTADADLAAAVRLALEVLTAADDGVPPPPDRLEIALLERTDRRRAFRRLDAAAIADLTAP